MKHQKALALITAVILLVTACCIVSVGVYSGGGNRATTIGNEGTTGYGEPIYGTLGNLRFKEYDNGVVITGCSGTSIEIPSSINGKPVTWISAGAFSGCRSLTSITIPDSVKGIGSYAFSGCRSLQSITIPDSVTNIYSGAFSGCSSLESVTLPNSVTSIGDYAFSGCSSLQSIKIPDSVKSIDSYAFSDCSSLKSITIPDSVTSIGHEAFYRCSLLQEIHISSISAWCNISFEISANPLSNGAELYLNNNRVENLVIPDGVTAIKDYTFEGFRSLKSITIPDSVTSIGDCAFYNCSSLQSITIPDSVTSIGWEAFYNCSSLETLTIGKASNLLSCFNGLPIKTLIITPTATNFSTVNLPLLEKLMISDLSAWCKATFSAPLLQNNAKLYINNALAEDITVGEDVESISAYAFSNCSSLKSITIPDSVTSIGNGAFYGCSSLQSITIGNSVTSIGNGAFYNCSSLQSVTIPDSVTSIGWEAFYNCSSLETLTIGKASNLLSCFNGLPIKTLVVTPTAINFSYVNLPSLEKLMISDLSAWCKATFSVGLFQNNAKLYINNTLAENITISDNVESISPYAFRGCSSLRSLRIPANIEFIGASAFADCSQLRDVYFDNADIFTIADSYVFPRGVTFHGYRGGTAEAFAKVFGYRFVALDGEPTTAPTEPTTAPTEPTTAPTEPTTVPTEPTTVPTEPTTVPTEPTTAPTEPTTVPTEPTTAPTESTTIPTEPTTAPTEPTTVPTEPTTADGEGEQTITSGLLAMFASIKAFFDALTRVLNRLLGFMM